MSKVMHLRLMIELLAGRGERSESLVDLLCLVIPPVMELKRQKDYDGACVVDDETVVDAVAQLLWNGE